MHRFLVYSVFVVVFAGCSDSTGLGNSNVVLIPTKNVYSPSETVSAQLFNRSEEQIGYGTCSLRVEQLAGGRWNLIGPAEVACDALLIVLAPTSTRVMQLQLDPTLESGTYRLRLEILPNTNLPVRYIYSPEFRLRNAA